MHLVATSDTNGLRRIFINGAKVAEDTSPTYGQALALLVFGTDRLLQPDNFFHGSMDSIRIYNRALSSAEVTQLYTFEDLAPSSGPAPIGSSGGGVLSGSFAPDGTGASDGTKFDMLRRGGFLAQNGDIVFPGFLEIGVGGVTEVPNTFYGIWKAVGSSVTRLARAGDNAPETGATAAKFDILPEVPHINDGGQVTLFASLKPSGASTPPTTIDNDTGLWSELGGTGFQILIREGDQIPGLPAGTLVGAFERGCFATAMTGSSTGEAAFSILMRGASTDTALLRTSVLGATVTAVSVVARQGQAAPGLPGQSFGYLNSAYTSNALMDAQGNLAFGTVVEPSHTEAIYYQPVTGGAPVKIAAVGDTAPGTGGATFYRLELPMMGDGGTLAFRGFLTPNTGDNTGNLRNDGIWRGTAAGGMTCILRRGFDAADVGGLPAGAKVGNLWNGWLNNNNRGAWLGWVDLNGDGQSALPADTLGIYSDFISLAMELIVKLGDAPDNAPALAFASFDRPVIGNGDGQVENEYLAFLSTVTGPGVNATNNKAVCRIDNFDGLVNIVLRTGDTVNTSQGLKTVADVDFPGSNDDASLWEQPVMDQSGRLLVYVTFTDGTTAQVLAP